MRVRRAVILPVVLFVLLLVGLLGAMFAFRVNADLASTQAVAYRLQTRAAAESGIEVAKLLLQTDRFDMERWYHNPDELHRIVVWAYDGDTDVWATNSEEFDEGEMVYRFSLVADDPTDDEDYVRFGLTDESAKLNLNTATFRQLMVLVKASVGDDEEINPKEIVGAILDWRDQDSQPQTEEGDTEGEYYKDLDKPYEVKNGPFDTVEELLLVKGVTNEILYGEDFDRNGLITPNERDGDETFPMDNQDDRLNRGLYPYLTVLSYEDNVSNDRRPRIYLRDDEATLREQLELEFEDEPEVVAYIITATLSQPGGASGGQQPDSTGSGDSAGAGAAGDTDDGASDGGSGLGGGSQGASFDGSTGTGGGDRGGKERPRRQVREASLGEEDGSEDSGEGEPEGDGLEPPEGGETDDAGSGSQPIRSPAGLLRPLLVAGEERPSPVSLEHLATLLDRTTLESPQERLEGLININTAPRLVLRCIEGLTDGQIDAIVSTRQTLDSEEKATPAWLLTEEVLDLDTFEQVAPSITARGQQFTIEALGYADHVGMVTRLQVTVDMIGPIVQTVYYRDLSYLGASYPIREEDLDKLRVR